MLVQRAVDYLAAVVFVNTVGGQDELVFDGHSLAIDQDGEVLARAPQFEEALTLCTIDPRAVAAARLRDTRHRVNVRRQRRDGRDRRAGGLHARERRHRSGRTTRGGLRRARRHARARRRDLRRAPHRPARLRREERLRARRDRALGRHRLGARGADRGRRARPRAGHLRVDAVALLERGHASDARTIAENLGVDFREIGIEQRDGRLRRAAARRLRGPRARTWPRRTSRRASAATSSWRCRTSSAGSCSPPATSPRCRWATPRSTATWRAASRC